jgi:hypothetical protein
MARTGSYLSEGTEGYNLAMEQTRGTLAGDYDPRTSDAYRGFRAEAENLRGKSDARIKRGAQAGGMLQSSPTSNIRAESNESFDSYILNKLGEMYETERNRQTQAGRDAGNLGQIQFGNELAAQGMLENERGIDQARNDAAYDVAIKELLHPYQLQANLAMNMMNYSPGVYTQAGGPSEWTKGVSIANDVSGMASGGVSIAQGLKKLNTGGGYDNQTLATINRY